MRRDWFEIVQTIVSLETSHHAEFLAEADMLLNNPKIFKEYEKKRIVLMRELRNTMVGTGHP